MAGSRRLYSDLAYLWPLVSPPEDYAEEAGHWRDAIRARLGGERHRILELGVGGGHNLSHLTSDFEATGVDLSPEMLEHSRRLNPGVEHHVGDMRTVRLGKVFDAVLIHDAVAYMLTEDDLRAAFATARAHLRPGGLLLVAPDLVAESFVEGKVLRWDIPPPARPGDPEVRVEERLTDPDPTDTTIESWITYTITEGGRQRVETDLHVTGLFPLSTWMALMEEAGFETETLPLPGDGDGCGENLFSGILREHRL
ncbi:MAG: class I SAM-dependent methyltransferase [bacterium]|nr:class I SAM-dependent methyltransferase [bacterium]